MANGEHQSHASHMHHTITLSGKYRKKYKFILCYLSSSAPVTLVTLKTPETPGVQDPVPRPVAVWGLRACVSEGAHTADQLAPSSKLHNSQRHVTDLILSHQARDGDRIVYVCGWSAALAMEA